MLPPLHQKCYQEFCSQVEQMRELMIQPELNQATLQTAIAGLQSFFQAQILNLSTDELPRSVEHHVQSYHVELDKQLKLLRMDMMFLQASRQSATTSQRQQQVCDRLHTLIRYCDALLTH